MCMTPFPPPQIESDCNSDGSNGEYQGETAHLPSRLLNGNAEVNYLEEWADVHEKELVCPTHDHKQHFLQWTAHLQYTE